jgi:hypothetical protein
MRKQMLGLLIAAVVSPMFAAVSQKIKVIESTLGGQP